MKRETPIQDRAVSLCMKVSGKAGEKTQEEVFLEFDAAVQQSDIFQAAGYKAVVIQPTHVVYDADNDEWSFIKFEGTAMFKKSAVPARYSRADINPCITVNEYDREREREQRTTIKQLVMAVMFTILVGLAPGFYLGIAISNGVSVTLMGRVTVVGWCAIVTLFLMIGIPPLRNEVVAASAQFAGIRRIDG